MEILAPVTIRDADGVSRKVARYQNTDGDPGDTAFAGDGAPANMREGDVWLRPGVGDGASMVGTYAPVVTTRSEGDITVPNTNNVWTDLEAQFNLSSPKARPLDIVIPGVKAGDVCKVECHGAWGNQAATPALDMGVIKDGALVRRIGAGAQGQSTFGIASWVSIANTQSRMNGGPTFVVRAGDIENGAIRLRPMVSTGAGGKVIFAQSMIPLQFEGHGPFPKRPETQIVFDGQSLNVGPVEAPYPYQLMQGRDHPYQVLAQSGKSWTVLLNTVASRAGEIYGGYRRSITVLNGGTSDLLENDTAQKVFDDLTYYAYFHKDFGSDYVIAATIPKTAYADAAQDAVRLAFNTLLRNNTSPYIDAVWDLANVPEMQDNLDATYFSDGTHFTVAGAAAVAASLAPTLDTALAQA